MGESRQAGRFELWLGVAIGVVLGAVAVAWQAPWSAAAQGPVRAQGWRYACERLPTREAVMGRPVFEDDDAVARALVRRDADAWELVTTSYVSPGVTLFCWRQPR